MPPRAHSIVLIGMMGAGKSSVGRALQRRTGLPRFDLDELIEARAGMSIPEIFAQKGETWFRDLESAVLAEVPRESPGIIVTGGGVVLRPGNVTALKQMGTVVWLDADLATLLARATRRGNRPLLQTADPLAAMAELLAARLPLYAQVADLRIDTNPLTDEQVTDVILAGLQKQRPANSP
jgi:shikimate kinase